MASSEQGSTCTECQTRNYTLYLHTTYLYCPRIDCIHAAGTIGDLTVAQRFRHLKQFMQYYYLPPSKENTVHHRRLQQV